MLEPADFIKGPNPGASRPGELDPSWFTVPTHLQPTYPTALAYLTAALAGWIAEGTGRVDGSTGPAVNVSNQQAAVFAWTLYRAYQEVLLDNSAKPASVSLPGLSKSNSGEQLKTWKEARDRALAQYEALAAPVLTPDQLGGFGASVMTRGASDAHEYGPAHGGQPFGTLYTGG